MGKYLQDFKKKIMDAVQRDNGITIEDFQSSLVKMKVDASMARVENVQDNWVISLSEAEKVNKLITDLCS